MSNTISYIWQAEQTSPGLHGSVYRATATAEAPARQEAVTVPGTDNLVYDSSIYSDWRLIGTAKGGCYTNGYGDFIELDTPENSGAPVDVIDVVRLGWYSRA